MSIKVFVTQGSSLFFAVRRASSARRRQRSGSSVRDGAFMRELTFRATAGSAFIEPKQLQLCLWSPSALDKSIVSFSNKRQ